MFESRKELFSKIEGLEAANKQLEADLAAALEQAKAGTDSEEKVLGLTEDLKAATEENVTLNEKLRGIEADLTAEKAKTTPEAIQALVTAELASAGHPPLNIGEKESKSDGTDFSNLKGLDRLKAALKAKES